MEITQVDENIYEIGQEDDMNVPARVYASELLLEKIEQDKTLEQVRNVATLPGIQKYSIVLPDGHQGYGFPIGGVAAVDMDDGVISPGGIGYDINCLSGDTEVLLEFGRRRSIEDLRQSFDDERAVVATSDSADTSGIHLFTQDEKTVYEVDTGLRTVEASPDHPFLTPEGMKPLREIDEGDEVYVYPFEGIEDEDPDDVVLLDSDDFSSEVAEVLEDRGLLPLSTADREFNILLKLVGYHTGDGSFNRHGDTAFYGEEEGLRQIQEDIRQLGFEPSRIYSRERSHEIDGSEFEAVENTVKSTSKAFQRLLVALGAPEGVKVDSEFTTPNYLDGCTDWQKALYLSAFFGAEMSSPAPQTDKNLYCPTVSHSRRSGGGDDFVREIKSYLEDLGIETNSTEEFESETGATRYRFGVKNDSENLIRLFTRVGYTYAVEKQKEAVRATVYLREKERAIDERRTASERAVAMYDGGVAPKEIKSRLEINDRFVERSIYGDARAEVRPPADFPGYDDFTDSVDVDDGFRVTTQVESIDEIGEKTVYDIGVRHDAHSFVADGFVVSNCGVRVLRTNLSYDDVRGTGEKLAERLYQTVPSGLGKGSYLDTDLDDIEGILEGGMEWMLENRHAFEEDLEHCEENGRLPGDPKAVPDEAKERGVSQVGSLGSGNHFLEVQRVSNLYDEPTAEAYGLEEDQIVVMIHTGSRGLGHQTCTNYLRRFEREYPDIVEDLPDKELIYAPIGDDPAEEYRDAMYAAANFAWSNRQAITQAVREVFNEMYSIRERDVELVYDVCHNIAKEETHTVDGDEKELLVHRKGATRAFPAGREEIPDVYQDVGQPVLIPGTMGTDSWILSGGEKSLDLSFGSTAHGAGRVMSRTQAKKDYWGRDVQEQLAEREIYVRAESGSTIAEEAPGAYKDVDEVMRVSDELGIGERVSRLAPIATIKG
ncbi:MAG: RtcB family protein [Halobacteria archaeon]|nr:RtcB family protein [Halobacteria archaeon]